MVLVANARTLERLAVVEKDVLEAARCLSRTQLVDGSLEDEQFDVREAVFAPKPQR